MSTVQLKKSLFGKYSISYACPHCDERLSSPIGETGKNDSCPNCNMGFIVPGSEERCKLERQLKEEEDRQDSLKREREIATSKSTPVVIEPINPVEIKPDEIKPVDSLITVGVLVFGLFIFVAICGITNLNKSPPRSIKSDASQSNNDPWADFENKYRADLDRLDRENPPPLVDDFGNRLTPAESKALRKVETEAWLKALRED